MTHDEIGGLVGELRSPDDDPYFALTPGVQEWLKRNWALRKRAATALESLSAERDQARAAAIKECIRVVDERGSGSHQAVYMAEDVIAAFQKLMPSAALQEKNT